jgi:ubiquinone/menaquinone biosynthesis C-methylase UbiE
MRGILLAETGEPQNNDLLREVGVMSDPRATNYVLASGAAELERLRLQARVWEPETERWLDEIGIQQGWTCADLGCGAMGIIGPLSQRVGASGRILGVDRDPLQLSGARQYVVEQALGNVEIVEDDAYVSALPGASFDFVHARFLLAPVGHDDELLREMWRLAKPGGIIALQEPDASAWNFYPSDPEWQRLKTCILAAFRSGGGDFNAGQRTFGLLHNLGLEQVHMRAAVLGLCDCHPYMRLPVQFAASLRPRLLGEGLVGEAELDAAVAACERIASDPEQMCVTFVVTQVCGRKPLA